jgi:hypothetical protein
MAFKLQIKRSSTNPGTSSLALAELGYQTANKRIFVGNGSGVSATEILNADDVGAIQTALQTSINGKANNTVEIIAGNHLSGGGTLSSATITVDHDSPGTESVTYSVNNSNGNVIQDLSVDAYGHIRALPVSVNLDDRYYTETEVNNLGSVTATANKWIIRDANGLAFATTPDSSATANTIATKGYVDGVAQGLDIKESVKVRSTGSFTTGWTYTTNTLIYSNTTAGSLEFDTGVTLAVGDRVLITSATATTRNGIYRITAIDEVSATKTMNLARADGTLEANSCAGNFTFVEQGNTYADTGWVCSTGTTYALANTWTQFSSAGIVSVAQGTQISVAQSGNVYTVSHGSISTTVTNNTTAEASSIVRSITVGTNGHVTAVDNMITLDCGAY